MTPGRLAPILVAALVLCACGAEEQLAQVTDPDAALIAAAAAGDARHVRELLEPGAHVNAKDSYNGTGLIRAAERGHHRIVRRLLMAGIERDHVNRLGWTALHEAIILGDGGAMHVETVRALIEGGVDVNVRGGSGRPLMHAEQRGVDGIVRILREAGARR
jgi:ankyrin repeat protein